ncbi:MAG: phytanoyl-CoA dioxygenase family protein [Bdellovibrionales bacterium]|nr:phytanoyl-CoA dioxygenase family protein [Bdellovibrionales bacterium]
MKLDDNQIRKFQDEGFLGPVRGFAANEIDEFLAQVSSILSGDEPSHHRHLYSEVVYRFCTSENIIGPIRSLLGDDLLLWASNFFIKEPGAVETPWHQDHNYGIDPTLEPPLNISIWLALDDVLAENSCMKFFPGSHRKVIPHEPPEPGYYFDRADMTGFDMKEAVDMELRKGEYVIFTDRVIHGAEPNNSELRRAGFAMRFTVPFVKILRPIKPLLISGEDKFGFNELAQSPV